MSEHPGGKDPFDAIIAGLQGDSAFAADISAAEASGRVLEPYERYLLPHEEVAIDAVGDRIHQTFQRLCEEFGIDPNHPRVDPLVWQELGQLFALEVYGMKRELWEGDIITARSAIIVENDGVDQSVSDVVGLSDGDRLIGKFYAPIIGPMPDDMTVMTRGEAGFPPVGVGLLLDDPVMIDDENQLHTDPFSTRRVIVALGTMGLKLGKHTYL